MGVLAIAASATIAGKAQGTAGALRLFATIPHGAWTMRAISGDMLPYSRLCLREPAALVHFAHHGRMCHDYVVHEDADHATISYICHGHGQGVTDIRRETSGILQVETQGIEQGEPFDIRFEARYQGACDDNGSSGRLTR